MTNDEVKSGFEEVYNGFWIDYRDKQIPKQSEEWERIKSRGAMLKKKYPFLAATVTEMETELDQRMRRREQNDKSI